jgi:hypothetical protein
VSGPGVIAPEANAACELCDKVAELRPYGPNGERVCFQCGMKDKAAAERGMRRYIYGEDPGDGAQS